MFVTDRRMAGLKVLVGILLLDERAGVVGPLFVAV